MLDEGGSLGPFLNATIAKSKQIENAETSNANLITPVHSPEERERPSNDFDGAYVELDDDLIEECMNCNSSIDARNLLERHAVNYKLSPDPKFVTSPINIKDKEYDFSVDLSLLSTVEPFLGTENESAVEHMNKLSTLSSLFSDDIKKRSYFVTKIFPFSLKDEAKTWFNNLSPGSIESPLGLVNVFFQKYFPASAQHASLQRIFNFKQLKEEKIPESWTRFCSLIRVRPEHQLAKNELLDIFYNGLTIESRTYQDNCAGCVFRKRTPEEAQELRTKISQNHEDWTIPESTPVPTPRKRGVIELNDEEMREAKKSLKERGIKSEEVKNLPPIEELCKPILVHSLEYFDDGDIPYSKPPVQCLDEFDNFIVKQDHFNVRIQDQLLENSRIISNLHDVLERTAYDVKVLVKHFHMVQTQIEQITKVQKDLLVNASKN